jgi:hypothetical protein
MPLDELEPLIGDWRMAVAGPVFPDMPPIEDQLESGAATCSIEWMEGREFVVQRSRIPDPSPDSLAVFGADPESTGYLQHYFDTRGVARVYRMTFESGEWNLWRDTPDFSELPFRQRFTGRFSDDGKRIECTWERTEDDGSWIKDFDLTYTRAEH